MQTTDLKGAFNVQLDRGQQLPFMDAPVLTAMAEGRTHQLALFSPAWLQSHGSALLNHSQDGSMRPCAGRQLCAFMLDKRPCAAGARTHAQRLARSPGDHWLGKDNLVVHQLAPQRPPNLILQHLLWQTRVSTDSTWTSSHPSQSLQ